MKKYAKKKLYIGIAILILLLNVLALSSNAFCDAYIAFVFPIWVNTYGRFSGLFPFSAGEWLIIAGALLVIAAVFLGVVTGVSVIVFRRKAKKKKPENPGEIADEKARLRYIRKFYVFFAWVVLIVGLIMTLNCTILYHASTFSEKYYGEDKGEYSLTQLIRIYNYVAENCNRLSDEVARAKNGDIRYPGSLSAAGKEIDMEDKAREAMRQLGKKYPQLDGYYPRPKPMFFSDFMCQQYMLGWYFPFSMEANYNQVAYVMNKPASLCHELAHLRGYIYEDEANFISYLACVQSDDIYFQYSGYLSVLGYLESDLSAAYYDDPEAYEAACQEVKPVGLKPIVFEDDVFVKQEEWDRIEEAAVLDTEVVDEITDVYLDTTLKVNGVSDGRISYSRVVRLLLQYYTAEGFP